MFTHEDFEGRLSEIAQRLQAACEAGILTELSVSVKFAPYYEVPRVQLQGAEAGQLARNLGHEPTPHGDHPHGWYCFDRRDNGQVRPQRHYQWEMGDIDFEVIETTDDCGIHGEELQALIRQHFDIVEARQEAELLAELGGA